MAPPRHRPIKYLSVCAKALPCRQNGRTAIATGGTSIFFPAHNSDPYADFCISSLRSGRTLLCFHSFELEAMESSAIDPKAVASDLKTTTELASAFAAQVYTLSFGLQPLIRYWTTLSITVSTITKFSVNS